MSRNKGWIQVHYVILQASKCLINSFRYSRVRGLEMLTKQLCFSNPPPHLPQQTRTVAHSLGIFIALSSGTPPSLPPPPPTPLSLWLRLCLLLLSPGRSLSPECGKSFWGLKGAQYLIAAHAICPFLLFKEGTSEPSSPRRNCSVLIEKASQEMFRVVRIILRPCGDLGKPHTHCK